MFAVYQTDNWHTYQSRDLIALCTTFKKAIGLVKKKARQEGIKLTENDLYNIEHLKQTQGLGADFEFVIEPIEINVLA